MINYFNKEKEIELANNIYYKGGSLKFFAGGDVPDAPLTPEQIADADAAKSSKNSALLGAGLGVASSAIEALDTDDKYGGADVAASTLKYASMGAVAGPWGAAAGAAVGLGVGLVQKGKFNKQEKKDKRDKEQTEGYNSFMKSQEEFSGYADGGVINKYDHGGETDHPVKKKVETNTNYLNADGTLNLGTTDPLAGYGGSTGTVTEDKGLWDEDASVYDNSRALLNKGVNAVQYASLRPGGNRGHRNLVATALTEMSAVPSINRIIKKDGDLDHISDDPTNAGAWTHLGLNALAAVPGVSAVTKGLKFGASKTIPFVNKAFNSASKYMKAHPTVAKAASVLELGAMTRQGIHATERIVHTGHRIDENRKAINGSYDLSNEEKGSYQTGGMTKGAYSHSTNPLKVVDKSGKDTGMELTGGEGVFDKPFMSKLKGILASGDYQEAGRAVKTEMKTWKHK